MVLALLVRSATTFSWKLELLILYDSHAAVSSQHTSSDEFLNKIRARGDILDAHRVTDAGLEH